MASNLLERKKRLRQAIKNGFGVDAFYYPSTGATPIDLVVKWHENRIMQGQLEGEGAQVIEGVDELVFYEDDLHHKGVELVRGAWVYIPGFDFQMRLEYQSPSDGPLEITWTITRENRKC